jgi:hypothetical protein
MMSSSAAAAMPPLTEKKLEKKPIKFSNLLLGAGLNLFEVTVRLLCILPPWRIQGRAFFCTLPSSNTNNYDNFPSRCLLACLLARPPCRRNLG